MQTNLQFPSSEGKHQTVKIHLFFSWIILALSLNLINRTDLFPQIATYSSVLTVFILIYPTIWLCTKNKIDQSWWELSFSSLKNDFYYFFLISMLIFIPLSLANHLYQNLFHHLSFHSTPIKSIDWPSMIAMQIVVGISEEFYFRGYMQTTLRKSSSSSKKIFGALFGWPEIVTTLVFALTHSLISLEWWHPFIFFPGIIFAWLRAKTERIWAGALFHAVCNLFSHAVALHYY